MLEAAGRTNEQTRTALTEAWYQLMRALVVEPLVQRTRGISRRRSLFETDRVCYGWCGRDFSALQEKLATPDCHEARRITR